MASNIEIEGIDDNLRRLAGANKKAHKKALEKGAEHIRQRLEQNTPISDVRKGGHKHLEDHTAISKMDSDGTVYVGFDNKVNYRAHFVELGTIYQRPQAFIQHTQIETKDRVMEIIAEELRRELGL